MAPEALNELLRENYPMVRAICWRILNNRADAEDATQNALLSVARRIDTFDGKSSISTWIYRIATNAALDELRRRRRRPATVGEERLLALVDAGPEDAFASIESSDYLSTALDQIPEEFRVAMVLRDVADLEYEEIGRILGVPVGTVRSRIARGRARLADIVGNSTPAGERHNPERDRPVGDRFEPGHGGPEVKEP